MNVGRKLQALDECSDVKRFKLEILAAGQGGVIEA